MESSYNLVANSYTHGVSISDIQEEGGLAAVTFDQDNFDDSLAVFEDLSIGSSPENNEEFVKYDRDGNVDNLDASLHVAAATKFEAGLAKNEKRISSLKNIVAQYRLKHSSRPENYTPAYPQA